MDYIDDIFGPEGLLAQQLPNYEVRKGQIELAKAIDKAMCHGHHCLAEGPCGTGKSVAYGVPAIAHAAFNKAKTVIATANIALQEQLFYKDLPFLASVLPFDFTFALLKGKNNYYCKEAEFASNVDDAFRKLPAELTVQMSDVLKWSRTTSTGDKTGLPFDPHPMVWGKVSVSSEECKNDRCSFKEECFYNDAKRKARGADIVVTNYHMLFAHLAVKGQTGEDLILPKFDNLVLDEAHEAPSIARDFFGFSLSQYSLQRPVRWLKSVKRKAEALELEKAAKKFFKKVKEVRNARSYNIRLRTQKWDKGASDQLLECATKMRRISDKFAASDVYNAEQRNDAFETSRLLNKFIERVEEATLLSNKNFVYWIEFSGKSAYTVVRGKPIVVSALLTKEVFDPTRCVIMTSATLTTGRNFEFIRREAGVPAAPATTELMVESPFDYGQQSLLVVPQVMPDPKGPDFQQATADALAYVIGACGGRTLCLFTSIRNMKSAFEKLSPRTTELPYTMLMQGDGRSRADIYKEFQEDETSCLFGVASFWTGIDVSGSALTGLVIDKLPFPNMSDPLVNAISERSKQSFWTYSMPKAIITLRQGIGRLLRTKTDRGVIVILDNRLLGGSKYCRTFLQSLPPIPSSVDITDVLAFVR